MGVGSARRLGRPRDRSLRCSAGRPGDTATPQASAAGCGLGVGRQLGRRGSGLAAARTAGGQVWRTVLAGAWRSGGGCEAGRQCRQCRQRHASAASVASGTPVSPAARQCRQRHASVASGTPVSFPSDNARTVSPRPQRQRPRSRTRSPQDATHVRPLFSAPPPPQKSLSSSRPPIHPTPHFLPFHPPSRRSPRRPSGIIHYILYRIIV